MDVHYAFSAQGAKGPLVGPIAVRYAFSLQGDTSPLAWPMVIHYTQGANSSRG